MKKIPVSKPFYFLATAAIGGLSFVVSSFIFGHFSLLHWVSLAAIVFVTPRAILGFLIVDDSPDNRE